MKNDNELLAAMPVRKAFFRLALPAVAAQLINILYNLVDKMFIGHIPGVGKQALAGVGVTAPVILPFQLLQLLLVWVVRLRHLFLWEKEIMNRQKKLWEAVPGC